MLLLGITTSDPKCSIAIARDGEIIAAEEFDGVGTCVEVLMPLILSALESIGAELKDVDSFAVDNGPGGLTGVKIGYVTMRTLAQQCDRPIVPVSALHAVAFAAPADAKNILVATKCSAAEVYVAKFERADGNATQRISEDDLTSDKGAAEMIGKWIDENTNTGGVPEIYLIGGAAERVANLMPEGRRGRLRIAPAELWPPRAGNVCRLARFLPQEKWNTLRANYVCITNAERTARDRGAKAS